MFQQVMEDSHMEHFSFMTGLSQAVRSEELAWWADDHILYCDCY